MSTRILATIDPSGSLVEARTEEGHRVVLDADPPEGQGAAARPKEALLAALAGCTSMDVASILRKKRQSAAGYEIAVSKEQQD
ncbi:MAG TPA: OsmC family protein, partial [Candidatus Limnocylindria bacterium]|nr:OsmC family protein [Candidatus Limnocylindria bacterium]